MKITKQRLKQIIKEELSEAMTPELSAVNLYELGTLAGKHLDDLEDAFEGLIKIHGQLHDDFDKLDKEGQEAVYTAQREIAKQIHAFAESLPQRIRDAKPGIYDPRIVYRHPSGAGRAALEAEEARATALRGQRNAALRGPNIDKEI